MSTPLTTDNRKEPDPIAADSSMTLNATRQDQESSSQTTETCPVGNQTGNLQSMQTYPNYPNLKPFAKVFEELQRHGYDDPEKLEKLKFEVNKVLMRPGQFEKNMEMYLTSKMAWRIILLWNLNETAEVSEKYGTIAYGTLNPPPLKDKLTDGDCPFLFSFMLPDCVMPSWTAAIPSDLRDAVKRDIKTPSINIESELLGMAVYQCTPAALSAWEALQDCFDGAAELVHTQLQLGLHRSQAAVAIIATTGREYVFALVTMVENNVAILRIVSDVITVNEDGSFPQTVVEGFARVSMFCSIQRELVQEIQRELVQENLNPKMIYQVSGVTGLDYHIKPLTDIYKRFGGSKPVEMNLIHMWRVFERLQSIQEVLKPLGVAKIARDDHQNRVLEFISCPGTPLNMVPSDVNYDTVVIFPRLHGYTNGVPTDPDDRNEFIMHLETTLKSCHERGVVHTFLEPTNIAWRKTTNKKMEIFISGWDAATIIGEGFTEPMRIEMLFSSYMGYYMDNDLVARATSDAWFVYKLGLLKQEDAVRMNERPEDMNDIFKGALLRLSWDTPNGVRPFAEDASPGSPQMSAVDPERRQSTSARNNLSNANNRDSEPYSQTSRRDSTGNNSQVALPEVSVAVYKVHSTGRTDLFNDLRDHRYFERKIVILQDFLQELMTKDPELVDRYLYMDEQDWMRIFSPLDEAVIPGELLEGATKAVRKGEDSLSVDIVHNLEKPNASPNPQNSVDSTTGDALRRFFGMATEHHALTLRKVKALKGPATPGSLPDILFPIVLDDNDTETKKLIGAAVIELKHTSASPMEALGQAFASAANLALAQVEEYGLHYSQVAIPIIVTTARLYLFAFVTLLLNNIAVLHVTSYVADIASEAGMKTAAEGIARVKLFVDISHRKVLSQASIVTVDHKFPQT
ncbi:hypothetical protein HDU76_000005 [Blyttiomyces sp. JEL0837]|nr:hypothetical protein HDU76_000005 [Blyttiomyces sp. JEL0837]